MQEIRFPFIVSLGGGGGEMEAQNRKWKDVLFIQFQKTGVVQYT